MGLLSSSWASPYVLRILHTLHSLRTESAEHVLSGERNRLDKSPTYLSSPFFICHLNSCRPSFNLLRAPAGGVLLVSSARANPAKFFGCPPYRVLCFCPGHCYFSHSGSLSDSIASSMRTSSSQHTVESHRFLEAVYVSRPSEKGKKV